MAQNAKTGDCFLCKSAFTLQTTKKHLLTQHNHGDEAAYISNVVPIRQVTPPQPTIRISAQRKELLAQYARAAANLYGVISLTDFVDFFNHYEPDTTTSSQEAWLGLERYLKTGNKRTADFSLFQEMIFTNFFAPETDPESYDNLQELLEQQGDKPRFFPSTEEMTAYRQDRDYISPQELYTPLHEYILAEKLLPPNSAAEGSGDITNLHHFAREGADPKVLLDYLTFRGYHYQSQAQFNHFLGLLTRAYNHTRMHPNKGHSPSDLSKPRTSEKIERNAPCPCGSGKKYKKCCYL